MTLAAEKDGEIVDGDTLTLQNLTIEGISLLNSFIRQHYIAVQRDAIKDWTKAEQENYIKIAQSNIVLLSVGTKQGNDILFKSDYGFVLYTWVFVKEYFPVQAEWEKVLRPSMRCWNENMRRFNEAMAELAILTSKEIGQELPEKSDNPEWVDNLIKKLMAVGMSLDEVKKLTLEQADEIYKLYYQESPEPLGVTNDPNELKAMIAEKLQS